MGSCWKREDMSFNGSATTTSWSLTDEEEEEAGDVTSSKESESKDDPLEIPETEEDVEEQKEPTRSSYSWTGPFFCSSISNVVFVLETPFCVFDQTTLKQFIFD